MAEKKKKFVLFPLNTLEDAIRTLALTWIFYAITVCGHLAKQILIGFLPAIQKTGASPLDLPPVSSLLALAEFTFVTILFFVVLSLLTPKNTPLQHIITRTQWLFNSWMLLIIGLLGILGFLFGENKEVYSYLSLGISIVSIALGFVTRRFNKTNQLDCNA